jgi:hypothetical protein
VTWLERAGDLAVGRYEIDDGIALLERAVELEASEIRRSDLWRKIGIANALKFDGEAFWTAMERSLEVCHDREICANTYADLALQTSVRSGMWPKRPDPALVDNWIDQALELTGSESRARAKALIARCFWRGGRETAQEASALAERLGDVELRARAFEASAWAAFADGDFAESLTWVERSLEFVDEIADPDTLADMYEFAIPACCGVGRFAEARRLAQVHTDVVAPLTPHHRLHGVAVELEVEELCGNWDHIIALSERTTSAVEENLFTPCIRNARSLLVTALAAAHGDDHAKAATFEKRAREVASEGYDIVLSAPRARLALARGEVDRAVATMPPPDEYRMGWALPNITARLDTLVAARDRESIESEAPRFLRAGTFVEPFALRALGVVREDEELIRQAVARFDEMRLEWHAGQTRALL